MEERNVREGGGGWSAKGGVSQTPEAVYAFIEETMSYHETKLGKNVRFLLPSLKLKQPSANGDTVEQAVHLFLMENFGGYTATSANLFGYWKEEDGEHTYGEHREFVVALPDDKGLPELKEFLAKTCKGLDEKCLYFEHAGQAVLLYGEVLEAREEGRGKREEELHVVRTGS